MTTVLKLGGSVVTDKDRAETVDEAALTDIAATLGDHDGSLVLVHGGGSFGHHHADRHGVTDTEGTSDADAVTAIHTAMTRLSDVVVERLQSEGVSALPVRPLSVATRSSGGDLSLPTAAVETMLAEGFVPVLHGDVVAHADAGATVLSGDDIVVALARALDATRVGLCSDVPGVLDDEGEVVARLHSLSDANLGGSGTTDVTGGMAAKVRKLLALPVPAEVFGREGLAAFLDGESPGTTIGGAESP